MKNERILSIFMIMMLSFTSFMQPLMAFADVSTTEEEAEELVVDNEDIVVETNDEIEEVEVEEEPEIEEVEVEAKEEKEPVKNKGDPVKQENKKVKKIEEKMKMENKNKKIRSTESAGEFKDELKSGDYRFVEIDGEEYVYIENEQNGLYEKIIEGILGEKYDDRFYNHKGGFSKESGNVVYMNEDKEVIKEGIITFDGSKELNLDCHELIPAFYLTTYKNLKILTNNHWYGCEGFNIPVLSKVDSENKKVIDGAKFEIVNESGKVVDVKEGGYVRFNEFMFKEYDGSNYDIKDNEVIQGKYVPKEPYKEGEIYTVREVEAPEGYIRSDKEFKVQIKSNDITYEGNTYKRYQLADDNGKYIYSMQLENERILDVSLKIIKNKGDKEPEVIFEEKKVYDENQEKLKQVIKLWDEQGYTKEDFLISVKNNYTNEISDMYLSDLEPDWDDWENGGNSYIVRGYQEEYERSYVEGLFEAIESGRKGLENGDVIYDWKWSGILSRWKNAMQPPNNHMYYEIVGEPKNVPEFTYIEPEIESNDVKGELSGAVFEVSKDGQLVNTVTTDSKGVAEVNPLTKGKYTIREVEAPEGYLIDENEYEVVIKDGMEGTIYFTAYNHAIEKINIPVEKVWKYDDSKDRPEFIEVDLLRNGKVLETVKLTSQSEWKYVFRDLDKTDSNGKEYKYTVQEREVEGYESSVTGNEEEGFTITNTKVVPPTPIVPATTSVDVEKVWKGKKQDSVTINLLADGEKVDSIELSEENDWKHTFTDLPVVNDIKDEKAIEYTIEEVEVDGYEVSISGNAKEGYVVTNTEIVPPTPELVKDVEGKEHLEVAYEKEYNYNVKTAIPTNLDGYKDLTLVDVLDKRLDVVDAKVLVDGKESDFKVEIKDQTVSIKFDRKQLETIKGKEVNLQITAKIKDGTDIELIDNKATIQLNDDPAEESNVVTVIPPKPVTPEPEKPAEPKVKPDPKPEVVKEEKAVEGERMPETATDIFNFLMIGLGLVVFGGVGYFLFRKKKESKEE